MSSAESVFAKLAYEAYGKATDGKNYLALPMPAWADLPAQIQDAWDAAATAVIDAVDENR
jgi:phage tail tape-measure protein